MSRLLRIVFWIWPLPWTLLGLAIGLISCCGGGRIKIYQGTLACWGPWLDIVLKLAPIPGGAAAITMGHAILARTEADMIHSHSHESVHVRQYERWGIFFVPAYFAASLWLVWKGRDGYRENPFELQAFQDDSTRIKFRT